MDRPRRTTMDPENPDEHETISYAFADSVKDVLTKPLQGPSRRSMRSPHSPAPNVMRVNNRKEQPKPPPRCALLRDQKEKNLPGKQLRVARAAQAPLSSGPAANPPSDPRDPRTVPLAFGLAAPMIPNPKSSKHQLFFWNARTYSG